ncbi:MAG: ABC transporter substrate-binding protein [Bernardetiaceae bacterium]|nr:ABC transporter substrate-binding protein [Bernardetiaceae bacterium]
MTKPTHNLKTYTDQMGRSIQLQAKPQRIISLVPSQTELIYDLGAGDRLVGVSKYCIHPKAKVRKIAKIGGTKDANLSRIEALKPDIIIGNKEENTQADIIALAEKYPVWMSDIYTLADSLQMIRQLGELLQTQEKAEAISQKIATDFEQLRQIIAHPKKKALYLIWKDPYMAAAKDTFIDDMLYYAGFENVLNNQSRYPTLEAEEIQQLKPEVVLLSSEPYPFKTKHIDEIAQILPQATISIVDGELFSWYGSRLLKTPAYFKANFT